MTLHDKALQESQGGAPMAALDAAHILEMNIKRLSREARQHQM